MVKINKSAARVVDVVELISKSESPLSITEISNALDIPKSSTFEIVYTLVEKDFLEITDNKLKTFKLGYKLFTTGTSYLKDTNLIQVAHPLLEEMMRKSKETVFLAVQRKNEIVYLDKIEGISSIEPACKMGSTRPLTCTALGKAILATYSKEEIIDTLGNGKFITPTKNSINNFEDLMKELAETVARGYAIDNRENNEEIFCIGAPIYDRTNRAIASISVSLMAYRLDDRGHQKFGEIVTETAMKISKQLGFTKNKLYFNKFQNEF